MRYTKDQKRKIKKAFSKSDREIIAKITDPVQARQIANGLRRVSPERAKKIADALKREGIIKILLPELFSRSA